jgi:drug/metabolite transporter (DMT)-like permease
MNPQLINWLMMASLVTMWGTSFMFVALALEGGFTPVAITTLRVIIGAAVLVIAVYSKGLRLPFDYKSLARFMLFGFFGAAAPFFFIAWGQQRVPSGTAGVLIAVMPLLTVVLAHYTVPMERLNRYKVLGLLIAFAGVFLLMSPAMDQPAELISKLSILAGASCYAINTVLVRLLPEQHPLVGSAGMLIGAAIILSPLSIYSGMQLPAELDVLPVFALLWIAILPTGIASLLYFAIISRAGPSFVANSNFFVPVVAFSSGIVLLGEPVTRNGLLALVIILAGIALSRFGIRFDKH